MGVYRVGVGDAMNPTFEVGKTYSCRSAFDHNCVWTFEVVKRTAKFITIREWFLGEWNGLPAKRRGVKLSDGAEYALPLGDYSFAPVIRAERPDNNTEKGTENG